MTEERRRVLDMLSEGRITVEDAERLLEALRVNHGGEESKRAAGEGFESFGEGFESFDEPDEKPKTSLRDDTFEVGENPRLVVRGFNGRVRVNAGSPGSIRVQAELKNPHGIEYSAVQEDDLVKVEAKPDRQSERFLHELRHFGSTSLLHGLSRQYPGANIEVIVPVTTSVDLATSNGPVELQGTENSGAVQTKNGPIRVEQFKGDLNATTKNASITVKTLSGSAELSTSNSRVSIEDAHGRFDARTTNGSIRFQGSVEPGSRNRLATSNGNIKVTLGAEPSLKLTASAVNGRVRCEVPGFVASVDRRRKLEGTVGEGEAELIAATKNGSIAIQ